MASQYLSAVFRALPGSGERPCRASACGLHMGRPSKLTPQQQNEARRRAAAGEPIRRCCPHLQRPPQHDFEAGGMKLTDEEIAVGEELERSAHAAMAHRNEKEFGSCSLPALHFC